MSAPAFDTATFVLEPKITLTHNNPLDTDHPFVIFCYNTEFVYNSLQGITIQKIYNVKPVSQIHLAVIGNVSTCCWGGVWVESPRHTKDVKNGTYCYCVRGVTSIVRVVRMPINWRNSLTCTVRTFRQRSCNQRVGCPSGDWTLYMAIISRGECFKLRNSFFSHRIINGFPRI